MARRYISVHIVRRVREAARDTCGYCKSHQDYVLEPLEIDHIIPIVLGGADDEDNLWLACPVCNGHKSDKVSAVDPETGETVPLFNPRRQDWHEHFRWSDRGIVIVGLTPIGRATVIALHLSNNERILRLRKKWVAAGWHPPKE